jgi:hypothetical protein
MKYKIQSKTTFGWMDVMGDFETIKEAQERIPDIQRKLTLNSPYMNLISIQRIVDVDEDAINDFCAFEK